MNSIDAINILEGCIKDLNSMSEEEFQKVKVDRKIDDEKYLNKSYLQEDVELILPGTPEYNKYFEETIFSKSIKVEYNEGFQVNVDFGMKSDTIDDNIAFCA